MGNPLLSLPLHRVPFAVLDVETTGLNPGLGDAICEIAVLRVLDGEVIGQFESLVNPGRPVSPEAYQINQISSEALRSAPPFAEIVDDVLELLQGSAIVAHNAPFDLAFLVAALEETRCPIPDNPVVDTLALARNCYGFPRNNLHTIARNLDIFISREHRAMADVETTWHVFQFFSQDLQGRLGIGSLGELIRAQGRIQRWPQPLARDSLPDPLAEALNKQRFLHLRYRSPRGQVSERVVEPLRVGIYRGARYLVARCLLKAEQRTFRLDRIAEMRLHEMD